MIIQGLWKYGLKTWTVETVFDVVLMAHNAIIWTDEESGEIVRQHTNLMNPDLQVPMTIEQIVDKAKTKWWREQRRDPISRPPIVQWPKDDEEMQAIFPFRSPADRPFRRSRILDLKEYIPLQWLNEVRNLDYITAMNLLWARLIHGEKITQVWKAMDMLSGLENFIAGASAINLVVKKYKVNMTERIWLAEMAGLTGYRQMPMPGFDIVAETKALADGGEPHGIEEEDEWLQVFTTAARKVMQNQTIARVEYVSLKEYIQRDLASTAGASSIGKVEYAYEDQKGKFKARKNLLYDIMTPDQIYNVVIANYGHQVATAFVKPEMGKLRIAVTGDIESYYVSSWLNYLAGHSYTTWQGNTLEESRVQQMERMQTTLNQLLGRYSLPFDYKGFDHQPTLKEIQIQLRLYLSNALYNVPPEAKEEVQIIIDTVVASFADSVTVVRDEQGKKWVFKVTGGVQSGVRLTSLLGNMWNQTMTQIVTQILNNPEQVVAKYIRGDDSSIITTNYVMALLFRLGYAAINAVGADAKYGIHYQETEFLRIWYANDRVYGYPNRAIPSLSQRKPWTSEPWDPEGVVRAQAKTVELIQRRLDQELPILRTIITAAWARKRKLSSTWLTVPVTMGGLGIYPWKGRMPDTQLPKLDYETVKVRFKTAVTTELRYGTQIQEILPYTSVKLTQDALLDIQQMAMRGKAGSDDLPGLNRIYRQAYEQEILKFRQKTTTWRTIWYSMTLTSEREIGLRFLQTMRTVKDLDRLPQPELFGKYQYEQREWDALSQLQRYQRIDKGQEFEKYAPMFVNDRSRLERKGMHRGMAIDWLFGKIPRYSASIVHDQAAKTVETAVAYMVEAQTHKTSREMWWRIVNFYWHEAELAFKRSALNTRLLCY